jgi:N-methylhydantoinase B/oxoprolinase/acetone carboxylase alpha subunit
MIDILTYHAMQSRGSGGAIDYAGGQGLLKHVEVIEQVNVRF